jgi:hypothetical protein
MFGNDGQRGLPNGIEKKNKLQHKVNGDGDVGRNYEVWNLLEGGINVGDVRECDSCRRPIDRRHKSTRHNPMSVRNYRNKAGSENSSRETSSTIKEEKVKDKV